MPAPGAADGPALPGFASTGAALVALLIGTLFYRLRLAAALADPRLWAGDPIPQGQVLRQLLPDGFLTLTVGAAGLLLALAAGRLGRRWPRLAQAAGVLVWTVLLFLYGMLCQAQRGTLLATGTGLTLELLREALEPAALAESMHLLDGSDLVGVVLPPLVFLLARPLLGRLVRRTGHTPIAPQQLGTRAVTGGLVAALGLACLAALVPAAPIGEAALHHPVGALCAELLRRGPSVPTGAAAAATSPGPEASPGADRGDDPGDTRDDAADHASGSVAIGPIAAPPTMELTGPLFLRDPAGPPIKKQLPDAGPRPRNVLVILMESTGVDYALKPQPDGRVAMPFLADLGRRGTLLANHFSAGNSSPRGIFSLMSGLYVMPEVAIWDVRKDVRLPSLVSYLGGGRRAFLVTPASLDWYFPHAFMQHAGFDELWGYHALPVRRNAPGGRSHARDEGETVGFFLKRLAETRAAGAPFVAVYYSFVAHWPYPDYGDDTHFLSPTRPQNLYYNNLHYLDKQIERIYKKCEELGLIEDTIIAIAGDHGESFGQHPHNYTHSRMSYNENFRTPALLLHPRLFPPRRVTEPTSHVDFAPTLLDGMGVSYDPHFLQGESLFQDRFQRRYIFLYGNEDTLSSISNELIKMQISLRDNSCWVFDLKTDPGETKRLSCQLYRSQQEALLTYRKSQPASLRRYNEYMRRGGTLQPPALPQQPASRPTAPGATVAQKGA